MPLAPCTSYWLPGRARQPDFRVRGAVAKRPLQVFAGVFEKSPHALDVPHSFDALDDFERH